MEITHIGHSCFKIKGKAVTIIIDPYDPKIGFKFPKQECDLLLLTHDHYDHAYKEGVTGYKLLVDGPGEYEANDVFIYGIPTLHGAEDSSTANTIYVIEIDGFTLLHLGDLGQELEKETLEDIPWVDVLMIPVGGKYTLDAEVAAKVVSSIEPALVIPMHYKQDDLTIEGLDPVEKFLDEMGADKDVRREDKLKLGQKSDVPEDTQVIILKQSH